MSVVSDTKQFLFVCRSFSPCVVLPLVTFFLVFGLTLRHLTRFDPILVNQDLIFPEQKFKFQPKSEMVIFSCFGMTRGAKAICILIRIVVDRFINDLSKLERPAWGKITLNKFCFLYFDWRFYMFSLWLRWNYICITWTHNYYAIGA